MKTIRGGLDDTANRRTILVVVGEDIIVRNLLATDFGDVLRRHAARDGARLVIVAPPDLIRRIQEVIGNDVEVHALPRVRRTAWELLLTAIMRNSISTHTNTWEKMRPFADGTASLAATLAKRWWTAIAGRSELVKVLLRRLFLFGRPDEAIMHLFDTVQPDVVVPLCLVRFDYDVCIAREGRRRGVPIVGMVRSWDNLTSHGLLNIVPDVLLLQNRFLMDAARRYQVIPLAVCEGSLGIPHYDAYHDAANHVIPRSQLCELLDLDPQKRIILYGAMGEFLFTRERDMITIFDELLAHDPALQDVQVVFRAHPSFIPEGSELDMTRVRVFKPSGFTGASRGFSNERILMSMIYHADVVITCGSTFGIDAFVLDRPLICVAFDGRHPEPYWRSAARYYDSYTHYEAFVAAGCVRCVRSDVELGHALRDALASGRVDPGDRRRVLDLFVEPFDGQAGRRLANQMWAEIRGARTGSDEGHSQMRDA